MLSWYSFFHLRTFISNTITWQAQGIKGCGTSICFPSDHVDFMDARTLSTGCQCCHNWTINVPPEIHVLKTHSLVEGDRVFKRCGFMEDLCVTGGRLGTGWWDLNLSVSLSTVSPSDEFSFDMNSHHDALPLSKKERQIYHSWRPTALLPR